MKKIKLIILWGIILFICSSCNNKLKYEVGKDTVECFGDGTYQIIHQVDKNGKAKEILSNQQYKQCVLTDIDEYKQLEDIIFFTGKYYENTVYCTINLNTNHCKYYVDIDEGEEFVMVYGYDMKKNNDMLLLRNYDEFSQEEQDIFKEINRR